VSDKCSKCGLFLPEPGHDCLVEALAEIGALQTQFRLASNKINSLETELKQARIDLELADGRWNDLDKANAALHRYLKDNNATIKALEQI